jgi:hypothetical protein
MITELTRQDVLDCLVENNLLMVEKDLDAVSESDRCYLVHLHAENLARVFAELAKQFAGIADDYLKECLKTPNERFRIEQTVRRSVDIPKLMELRPDLYESYRIVEPAWLARRFTPWDLISLMKKGGVTEDELRSEPKACRVRVEDIRDRISEAEKQEIFKVDKISYTVSEATE